MLKRLWSFAVAMLLLTGVYAAVAEETESLVPDLTVKQFEVPDTEAMRFIRNLKVGWVLGNTFDASDCTWLSNEMDYESGWCGVKTTEKHIQMVKDAGFNTIRIPVSWHNHLSDKENYIISEKWLTRVQEVVDWSIQRDLYVIINIHHDNSKAFLYPDSEHLEQSVAYVTSIWTQLSERFKDYDEHLMFASMNEPRLVGHPNEWGFDSNNAECRDAADCINKLNQAFVDIVRASGGNNATRYLICPGYSAAPAGALYDGFVLPTDPVEENDHRIIVSIHAYTPYNFALQMPGTDHWSHTNGKNTTDMVGFMNSLYNKFVSQGQPVIIDEFGALSKGDNLADRVDFTAYYVASARGRGMTCIWWDNNAFSGDGEKFGVLDRKKNEWAYPEIVEAMIRYAE